MKRTIAIALTIVLMAGGAVFSASKFQSISVVPNEAIVLVNGKLVSSENFNYNGRIYVPMRAVGESLGASVEWDSSNKVALFETSVNNTTSVSKTSQNNDLIHDYTLLYMATCSLDNTALFIIGNIYSYQTTPTSEATDLANAFMLQTLVLADDAHKKSKLLGTNSDIKNLHDRLYKYASTTSNNLISFNNGKMSKDSAGDAQRDIYLDAGKLKSDIESKLYLLINETRPTTPQYSNAGGQAKEPATYTQPTNPMPITKTPEPKPTVVTSYNFPWHLYSNDGKEYLGKLVTNTFDSDSVWNEFGAYGSEFRTNSIWNEFGTYGSQFSSKSAFNEFATSPPKILDNKGNFVGYLTNNTSKADGFNIHIVKAFLIDNFQ